MLTCAFREGRAPDAKRSTALKALELSELYPISVTLRQLLPALSSSPSAPY